MSSAARKPVWAAVLICLFAVSFGGCEGATEELDAAQPVARAEAALTAPPVATGCTSAVSGGRQYWFCSSDRTWALARQACTNVLLDLATVETVGENTFIRQRVADNAWLGGSDQAAEGAWFWLPTALQFWQGTSSGTATLGRYNNWDSLQPNSASEDCLELQRTTGKWRDQSCSNTRDFVCEGPEDLCPLDVNKVVPGQCGCDHADDDTDHDGVADCVDGCVSDAGKSAPGQCGCGNVDSDADGDGSADCVDACDEDATRAAQPCSPDADCDLLTLGSGYYFFCDESRRWDDAQDRCESAGMQLARIDTLAENTFITQHISTDTWLGGSDAAAEGTWRWAIGGDQFWQGTSSGTAVPVGAFTRWDLFQPGGSNDDCMKIETDSKWEDDECDHTEQYVCEAVDACLGDANKLQAGVCGCGVSDIDVDNDGTPDCHDQCPLDPAKIVPGDCGCANAPVAPGIACDDGLCSANSQCDGAGSCGDPEDCSPDASCVLSRRGTTPYWFCADEVGFDVARASCQSVGMDLVTIESAGEDAFITGLIDDEHAWIGGSDAGHAGTWTWLGTEQTFWTGGDSGAAAPGAYANWQYDAPDVGISGDCATKIPAFGNGEWETFECSRQQAYVCELVLHVEPIAQCVRRYNSTHGAVLMTYLNDADIAVVVPHGPDNVITTAGGSYSSPQVLEPGGSEPTFWVPTDFSGPTSWTLLGETAVADGSTPLCELSDMPPENQPEPQPEKSAVDLPNVQLDGPTGIVPDVTSVAFVSLSGPIHGSERGVEAGGAASVVEAPLAPFTFTVNSLHFSNGEGLCGTVDPFINNLVINGVGFGGTSGTVFIPRNSTTVHVSIDVNDDDAFLCLADDNLRQYEFDIDVQQGEANCTRDGSHICITATSIKSPDMCFVWNAQFMDAGPWDGGVASEDFLSGKGIQSVAASFSRYRLRMANSAGLVFDRGGVLDERGCIPAANLPIREHWARGTNLTVQMKLISQLCLDPSGSECLLTGTVPAGANAVVRAANATGPASLCTIISEVPGSVVAPGCTIGAFPWLDAPPPSIAPTYTDQNSVTRVAAVVAHMFARETETNGGLGIRDAMIQRRLEDNGLFNVDVDTFCEIEVKAPCTPAILRTSCRSDGTLLLQPDDVFAAGSRFKNVVAHEVGHFIQGNGQGLMQQNYGCGAGDPNQPALCRCDHIAADKQSHCLQSLEEPNAAQMEGFGYFYSAKVFNRDLEPDCTMIYGKQVANTACMPGAASCALDSVTGFFVSQPPVPINCRDAERWRNDECADPTSSPDVLASGVEWDWVQFFYAVNNDADPVARFSVTEIFNAYLAACGSGTSLTSCTSERVSWAGSMDHFSLLAGANALAASPLNLDVTIAKSPVASAKFEQLADAFGVSNQP